MTGEYRCSRGHNWPVTAGPAGRCPVCGDTAALAGDLTVDLPPGSGVADPPGSSVVMFTPNPDAPVVDVPPARVPGYDLLDEVGRGGMGVVYRATDQRLGRTVAVKMILSGVHAGPAERERFEREAQAVAALQHPNIVQVFEVGEADGHPYLVLEFVDGGSLAEYRPGVPWAAREAAGLVEVLARAVHYAHTQGVIHRDLKPANILLAGVRGQESGVSKTKTMLSGLTLDPCLLTPKVTDFGLAKRLDSAPGDDGGTKTGAVMGTPGYIAPEQASGKAREVGPAADVYALGAILYELLTGRPPFRGETPLDTVLQVVRDEPVPPRRVQPSVPRDLETICLKCLSKSPAGRYDSGLALAEDVGRFLAGEPIRARPLSALGRGAKWVRRHPTLAGLGAGLVAATAALVAVLAVSYVKVSDAYERVGREALAAKRAKDQEEVERRRAQLLADENDQARAAAVAQADELARVNEQTRRMNYALQLTQVAALAERDPARAAQLLDDPARCPPELRDFSWEYLRRLCRRDDRVFTGHPDGEALNAVAVAPGGAFVATGGGLGTVQVWDPRTGRTFAVLAGHRGPVRGLAFSPDGQVLATAGADGTVRLWEFPSTLLDLARRTMTAAPFLGQVVRPALLSSAVVLLADAREGANCVRFSPDGRVLAAGLGGGSVRVYDLTGWRANPAEAAVAGGPAAVGLLLARGGEVRPAADFPAGVGAVRALAFAETGSLLAVGGDAKQVALVSTDGWGVVRWVEGYAGAVRALALTPDGKTLASVNNGPTPTIRLTNTDSGRDVRRLIGHRAPVLALSVSPDGQLIASGGADGAVRLWDVDGGRERGVLRGHAGEVRGLAFGGDRRTVVSAGADGTARVWQAVARPSEDADLTGPGDGLLAAAAVAGTGGTILMADEAGRVAVRLTEPIPGRPTTGPLWLWSVPVAAGGSAVRAVTASPDGSAVVAAGDGELIVWRFFLGRGPRGRDGPGGGLPLAPPPVRVKYGRAATVLATDPTGRVLVSRDAEAVRVWDLRALLFAHPGSDDEVRPRALCSGAGVGALAVDPAGGRVALGVGPGVRLVDAAGNPLVDVPNAHPAAVTAVAFDATGERLATADARGLVKVWRAAAGGGLEPVAELAGHTDAVLSVAFDPDGRTLATGGADRQVVLWDPQTGQERAVLTGHADRVLTVRFTTDGSALVTVGRDGALKRWRTESAAGPVRLNVPPPPVPPGFSPPLPPGPPAMRKRG